MILDSGFRFVYFPYMNNIRLFIEHQIFVVKVWSERINSFRYSFFVNSVFLWNCVSLSILSISGHNSFRSRLYSFLFCNS